MADAHGLYGQGSSEASQLLATFWPRVMNEVRTKPFNIHKSGNKKDEPIQELPLARIKKIMKQDGEVKMISAEAPILFSKAAEIFISELSLRAWIHTEDNKRRTLQRNDIAMAITKYDQFDFLIDIVPRDELKPAKRQEDGVRQSSNVMAPEQIQYYVQLAQLQQQAGTSTASPGGSSAVAGTTQLTQLPPGAHIIQQANGQLMIIQPAQLQNLTGASTNAHLVQIPASDQSATPGHTSLHQQLNPQTSAAGKGHGTAVGTQASQGSQVSGSQLQYIRIPQVPFIQSQQSQQQHQQAQGAQQQQQGAQQQQQGAQQHAGGQVSQGITAQVLQFHALNQLTQQQATSSASSAGQDGATQQVTDSGYSQIYHSIPGLPQGTIYVMAQAATSAGDQADGQE